jgi:hypothetical protein
VESIRKQNQNERVIACVVGEFDDGWACCFSDL